MTTFTIQNTGGISFKKTSFQDIQELLKMLQQIAFEQHLDAQYKKVRNAPKEDFVNL